MSVVIRRGYSAPERLSMCGVGAASAGAVYPTLMHYTHGQGVPCPLRTLTGIPCPFCGLTTATVALTHGQWAAAAGANPMVYPVAALVIVTLPVLMARMAGLAPGPRPWSQAAQRRTTWVVACVFGLSWLFQLHRFGFL